MSWLKIASINKSNHAIVQNSIWITIFDKIDSAVKLIVHSYKLKIYLKNKFAIHGHQYHVYNQDIENG